MIDTDSHDVSADNPATGYNPEVGHEHRDVNVRAILWTAGGLIVGAILIHLAIWGVFDAFERREKMEKRPASPMAARAGQRSMEDRVLGIPAPRLEGLERMQGILPEERPGQLHPENQPRLQTYGWVNKKEGIIHIPIETAMKVMVDKGLLKSRPAPEEGKKPGKATPDLPGGRHPR